ncbi:unnamed protein product, partial [Gadus morhua 'NCC']
STYGQVIYRLLDLTFTTLLEVEREVEVEVEREPASLPHRAAAMLGADPLSGGHVGTAPLCGGHVGASMLCGCHVGASTQSGGHVGASRCDVWAVVESQ